MVKAMAASKTWPTRSTCRSRSPGPNAQRQIQQINSMVQAGAEAIVVYPISPTALNQVVKNACDKGVLIFAYDADDHRALRLQRHHRPGRGRPEDRRSGWSTSSAARATSWSSPACPGTSVDTARTEAAKEVFAKYPGIKIVAEGVGMWSQAVARTELSKILATHPWDRDRRPVDAGRLLHRRLHAGGGGRSPDKDKKPCAGEGSNGAPHPDAAGSADGSRVRTAPTSPMGVSQHLLRLAALLGRARAEARGREARRQGRAEAHDPAAAALHQRPDQALQGGHLGGDEGRLQRLPARRSSPTPAGSPRSTRPRRPRSACRPPWSASPSSNPAAWPVAGDGSRPSRTSVSVGPMAASRGRRCEVEGIVKAFGATVALDDASFAVAGGRGPCAARRERRRQVDDRQAALRPRPAGCRRDRALRRAGPAGAARATPTGTGVQTAFQEMTLVRDLTVPRQHAPALGARPGPWASSGAATGERLVGRAPGVARPRDVDPRAEIRDLDLPVRQKIEIARAVFRQAAHPAARRADLDPLRPRHRLAGRAHRPARATRA